MYWGSMAAAVWKSLQVFRRRKPVEPKKKRCGCARWYEEMSALEG